MVSICLLQHYPKTPESQLERFLTPAEIAATLKVDISTARRLFADLPGVLKIGRAEARAGKRSYVSLRVPLHVFEQFLTERSK
jgi:hypothetical protein